MKTTETEPPINGEQRALTRYIPWLLQPLLLLTVLPYLSLDGMGQMALTRDGAIFGTLLLLFLVATKARQQNMVTALVVADTVVVSCLFMSLRPGEAFLPYPYFVILMIALLGQNIQHIAGSVALLCLGYFGVVYHHHLLSQQYLLLLPVMVTMTALVTCHVFRSELLSSKAEALRIGERLLEKVKAPMVIGSGRAVTVGASIEAALAPIFTRGRRI